MSNPYSSNPRTVTFSTERIVDSKLGVILSSVRPFGQNPTYDMFQIKAIDSWFKVAQRVYLFNLPSDTGNMQRPGLIYIGPNSNPPSIKQMLSVVKDMNPEEIVAICNSDITLTSDAGKIPAAVLRNGLGMAWACTGFRQTLNPETGVISSPADYGLDFFCSTARIWKDVEAKIPGVLTFGKIIWDNWVNGFFHSYIDKMKYWDCTDWKFTIHPIHGEHFRLGTEGLTGDLVAGLPGGLPTRKLNKT